MTPVHTTPKTWPISYRRHEEFKQESPSSPDQELTCLRKKAPLCTTPLVIGPKIHPWSVFDEYLTEDEWLELESCMQIEGATQPRSAQPEQWTKSGLYWQSRGLKLLKSFLSFWSYCVCDNNFLSHQNEGPVFQKHAQLSTCCGNYITLIARSDVKRSLERFEIFCLNN